ncbi:hypothetical protein [[Mycobacterium] nativiensis]|uniref:Uncharacterized protein n=1 Tax=[Mycobacterium] nativiensis TaxID=2855503 RepID=A0ABU5XYJ0_9MYCO|nr:hypothetical protein [Mycolicibacter sp. MYC340]MEB3033075.1 hypothetical protein [Mycolicibacter sp. MYC340]
MTPPPWPAPPAAQPHRRSPVALAGLAILLSIASTILAIVALTRSATSTPTYTAAETSAAKTRLCDQYKLASQVVHMETTGPDGNVALARIANTNGALMLESAASDPAVDAKLRDAARALAASYQTVTAMGTKGQSDNQLFWAAVDDSNAKNRELQGLCGD